MGVHMNIPVFIPHLGCKNDCVFCNQHSITGKLSEVSASDVKGIIETHLKYAGKKDVEIAFFGGSFTGLDMDMQRLYLKTAYPYVKNGFVKSIRLSTRPDYISNEILDMLEEYSVKTIELGAQSMSDDVLKASGRGHTVSDTERAAHLIRERGFSLGLQMMLGLPGDTHEKSIFTAKEIVRLKADCTRIYPTVVLKKTKLYEMYKNGDYTPIGIEEAVDTAKEAVKIFDKGNVSVLRIGLQQSDTLGDEAVAGAYHPAMGELVLSRFVRDDAEEYIKQNTPSKLVINADKHNVSVAKGQKRCNILYLLKKYNIPVSVKLSEKEGIYINDTRIGRQINKGV